MIKTLLLCLMAATLSAQTVFQKKMDGLQETDALAVLPDGGYVLAGLKGNCIQILRFNPDGTLLWNRQVCPKNPNADISMSSLHLQADRLIPGAFLLLFRKGASSSTPDNLLNLVKFDALGHYSWERQLKPEKRYGPISAGNQLAITPDGTSWVVHAMGFTDPLPDYNMVLAFKVLPDGTVGKRSFYFTDTPATAHGVFAESNAEIYFYGSLGTATNNGFILKVDASNQVQWGKQYTDMNLVKDGGLFSNGDFLLVAEYQGDFALTRINPMGGIVWAYKFKDSLSIARCVVTADDKVVIAGKRPYEPALLCKINGANGTIEWAKTYEDCTRFNTKALESAADGGIAMIQCSVAGAFQTRFFKTDEWGQLSANCPSWTVPLPSLENITIAIANLPFTLSDKPESDPVHLFDFSDGAQTLVDACPAEYPEARFEVPDSVCVNAPFELFSSGNDLADDWYWEIPGATPATGQGHSFQPVLCPATGDFPVRLIERIGNCRDTFAAFLHVVEAPEKKIFQFTDTTLCPDRPFYVRPDVSGANTWRWEDGSDELQRVWEIPHTGTYKIAVQYEFCTLTDSFQIRIGHCGPTRVYIPNTFSPNEDGQNDDWTVFLQAGAVPLECQVYDRWGSLRYRSSAGEIPSWDGSCAGRQMPAGVYVWQLRLLNALGEQEFLKGDVLLLR